MFEVIKQNNAAVLILFFAGWNLAINSFSLDRKMKIQPIALNNLKI
jgi:hypothetical protein